MIFVCTGTRGGHALFCSWSLHFALFLDLKFCPFAFAVSQTFFMRSFFCARSFALLSLYIYIYVQQGVDSQNTKFKTGQTEKDGQKWTGRIEQAEQDRQYMTSRTGQAEQDRQKWTDGIGQAENRQAETEQLPGRGC